MLLLLQPKVAAVLHSPVPFYGICATNLDEDNADKDKGSLDQNQRDFTCTSKHETHVVVFRFSV